MSIFQGLGTIKKLNDASINSGNGNLVLQSLGNQAYQGLSSVTNGAVDLMVNANAGHYLDAQSMSELIDKLSLAEKSAAQTQYAQQVASAEKAMKFESEQAELNRLFQQSSAEKAMKFEADQAEIARKFSERMSNSAYQRAVVDLKKLVLIQSLLILKVRHLLLLLLLLVVFLVQVLKLLVKLLLVVKQMFQVLLVPY